MPSPTSRLSTSVLTGFFSSDGTKCSDYLIDAVIASLLTVCQVVVELCRLKGGYSCAWWFIQRTDVMASPATSAVNGLFTSTSFSATLIIHSKVSYYSNLV